MFPKVMVVSVDENMEYLAATRRRISQNLADMVAFMHNARCEAFDSTGVRTCYYDATYKKMFPANSVELVYVDGPSADNGVGDKLPSVDVIRLKDEGWQIGYIVFDVRINSVRYLLSSGRFDGHR